MLNSEKSDSALLGDAEPEDVANPSADEKDEADQEAEDGDDAGEKDEDEQDPEGEDGASEDEDSEEEGAATAKQPPKKEKKPAQSKHDDTKYATARKDAEAKLRTEKAEHEATKARLDQFARDYGYTDSAGYHPYKDFADMQRGEQVKKYVDSGMSASAAQELASLKQRLDAAEERAAKAEGESNKAKLFNQLLEEFPELRGQGDLPQEVYDAIDAGETPVHAYRAWENKNLKDRLRVLETRRKNDKKAVGSAKGAATGKGKRDDFTAALFT